MNDASRLLLRGFPRFGQYYHSTFVSCRDLRLDTLAYQFDNFSDQIVSSQKIEKNSRSEKSTKYLCSCHRCAMPDVPHEVMFGCHLERSRGRQNTGRRNYRRDNNRKVFKVIYGLSDKKVNLIFGISQIILCKSTSGTDESGVLLHVVVVLTVKTQQ